MTLNETLNAYFNQKPHEEGICDFRHKNSSKIGQQNQKVCIVLERLDNQKNGWILLTTSQPLSMTDSIKYHRISSHY